VRLVENGGSGVQPAASVETQADGGTRFLKTGLRAGVMVKDGVAISLSVREGGRGYAVGDRIIIPPLTIGNTKPIVGEVTEIREETLGTVHNPDGTVDINSSYSQWDLDNGYIPRIFRRDGVHFTPRGAEYLCHLLAEKMKANNWLDREK
jgi:hypothetical protein